MAVVGSFTFEFHEHLPRETFQDVLDALRTEGVQLEEQTTHRFVASCKRKSQVMSVGLSLLVSHVKSMATIVSVSGSASAAESDYQFPRTRQERKRPRGRWARSNKRSRGP
jgi:hypothetical protein